MEKAILLLICVAFTPGNIASTLRQKIAVGPDTDKIVPIVTILNSICDAKCFGVLITKHAILTTDKCAELCDTNIATCKIQLTTQGGQELAVKTVVKHQDDAVKLAILITEDGADHGAAIAIEDKLLDDNLNVTVVGLGNGNDAQDILQTKMVEVSKKSKRNLYCFENAEAYSCKDEGAPMYMDRNLIGIASDDECSEGAKCYIAVHPYRHWIISKSMKSSTILFGRMKRASYRQNPNETTTVEPTTSTGEPETTTKKSSACVASISLMSVAVSAISACIFAF